MTKPITKAKIKFCKFEGALAMQVLYLDERFNIYHNLPIRFFNNKVSIEATGVGLYIDPINYHETKYAVGLRTSDAFLCFDLSPTDSVEIIFKALKHWAQHWEGWNDEPAIDPVITEFEGGVVYVEV